MKDHLTIQLLGGLRAQRNGVELDLGGARQRRVLAVLALSLGRPVPADRLIELVWGDEAPGSARVSLQSYVSRLRGALEPRRRPGTAPTVLATRTGGYVLDLPPGCVDLARFEQAVASGLDAHRQHRPQDATAVLAEALASWAPLLPELADVPVVVAASRRAEALRTAGTEVLARARLDVGDHHAAVADLQAAVTEDPRAESLWALLALALARSGRHAEALDTVAAARRLLRERCGLEIGDELRRIEADLLDPTVSVSRPTGPDPTPPTAGQHRLPPPGRAARRPARQPMCSTARPRRAVGPRRCTALAR